MIEQKPDKTQAPYWVKDNQFIVVDGWCWGVDALLRTVCVGKVEDVLKESK